VGGLAAALSTASGLLLVISSSLAHDGYYRMIDPGASESRRLLVGRFIVGLAIAIAGYFGIAPALWLSNSTRSIPQNWILALLILGMNLSVETASPRSNSSHH
jgi:Na+/proline symporter